MPGNPQASVFIGNLDEKVDERVLYEIMVQAGPLIDIYVPRDKETNRHKGYAFAEFTSEDSAQYAVNLFTGLVFLHKKLLRFSISGQGKVTNNMHVPQDVVEASLSANILNSKLAERVPVSGPNSPVGYASSPVGSRTTLVGYPTVAGNVMATSTLPVIHDVYKAQSLRTSAQSKYSGLGSSNYPGLGHRLHFSPVPQALTYNAHLVSLGQAGVQSHFGYPLAYQS